MYDISRTRDEFEKNNKNNNNNNMDTNENKCKFKYTMVNYDKKLLTDDVVGSYGLCRSVIFNDKNELVSFSPPKSIKVDNFISSYPIISHEIVFEEFVEGTMIHLFWDKESASWEISTKKNVGANTSFYKSKPTFREMFFDAVKKVGLNLNFLDEKYCYNFVLQHPENKMVIHINEPDLYLIAVYEICENGIINIINTNTANNTVNKNTNTVLKDCEPWDTWDDPEYGYTKFPKKYAFDTYNEGISWIETSPFSTMGLVIKNISTGERCKIRNPAYENVKRLRGNQSKLKYQYLTLRKDGKVSEYLRYFPEDRSEFSAYRDEVHNFTTNLYKNYLCCYVYKEKPLLEYPSHYRTHMFSIHEMFKREKEICTNFYVKRGTVIDYVNVLHPSQLMFALNISS